MRCTSAKTEIQVDRIASNWFSAGVVFRAMDKAFTDLEKMIELSQIPKDVDDAPGAQPIDVPSGSVTFENVSFNYGLGTSGQLSNISFTIEPGKTTAIIGPTGSGKSTIVRLLLRFYDVHTGRILIDGQNISSVTQSSLRHAIGVVAQDTVLFNDTLEYNVNYGKPDASTEDVQNAIAAAQLTEFVSHQPEGLATRVGERGKYLRLWSFDRKRMAAREPTHMEMLKSLFAALSFVLVFQD
uniref:Probable ATP-dependent transporter ycf16 n=1 Tax=Rhodosorus marinus TaxID=101924 RepID=A0A7S3E5W5_9RHOD|mmetsp:Transcript_10499/g.43736  ORF Transcript_10499/g.43736 Transcript_10499/m.43736 type:complete len:240 (+) Transcript_10499:1110-1829(+)